ncbi:MAG: TetR/AcrR family transcriptional regulator [Myxococcota bacterium]
MSTRGRPRSAESQARILAATVHLVETQPWSALTVEVIAAKAKVGKQTIYKWWGGRAALVMDAFLSSMSARVQVPDSGHIERDLSMYLKRSSRVLRETNAGRLLAVVMAESQFDEELAAAFRERFVARRRDTLRKLLERGVERGQLRPDLDLELVMDLLFGVFWYRLLVGQRVPLSDAFVEKMVKLMLRSMVAPRKDR